MSECFSRISTNGSRVNLTLFLKLSQHKLCGSIPVSLWICFRGVNYTSLHSHGLRILGKMVIGSKCASVQKKKRCLPQGESFSSEQPDHLALGDWWQELWLLCLQSLPGLNLSVPIKSRRNKTWEWPGLCLWERGELWLCVCVSMCVCLGSPLVSVVAQFGG